MFKVGRCWSHLTLEPVFLPPATGKEHGKLGDLSSKSRAACDGGIIDPTSLNKGHEKFHPSPLLNGLRVFNHST